MWVRHADKLSVFEDQSTARPLWSADDPAMSYKPDWIDDYMQRPRST